MPCSPISSVCTRDTDGRRKIHQTVNSRADGQSVKIKKCRTRWKLSRRCHHGLCYSNASHIQIKSVSASVVSKSLKPPELLKTFRLQQSCSDQLFGEAGCRLMEVMGSSEWTAGCNAVSTVAVVRTEETLASPPVPSVSTLWQKFIILCCLIEIAPEVLVGGAQKYWIQNLLLKIHVKPRLQWSKFTQATHRHDLPTFTHSCGPAVVLCPNNNDSLPNVLLLRDAEGTIWSTFKSQVLSNTMRVVRNRTHTRTAAVCVCTWVQRLQAAGHEQQCRSSKQPKGKQVALFSALFFPCTSPTSEQPAQHPQTR